MSMRTCYKMATMRQSNTNSLLKNEHDGVDGMENLNLSTRKSQDSSDTDSSDSEESEYSESEEEESDDIIEEESDIDDFTGDSDDQEDVANNNTEVIENSNQNMHNKAQKEAEVTPPIGGDPHEYDYDSSDEEEIRNTVGNVPMEWYRDYPHIGYDTEGRKLLKPKKGDELDKFLSKMDDANYWRTITNKMTGQNVILSDQDIATIKRIQSGQHPDGSADPYAPWVDFFSHETMLHPVTNRPEHKRSFVPSKWEKLKVGQMVHAIKMGWMKTKDKTVETEDERKYYTLWKEDDEPEISRRLRQHIPAPKLPLPGHAESYNPPPEYLFTKEEEEKWKEMDPDERRMNFIPKKYSSLRVVPAYDRFINERFERCLDLYLCPRQRKMRMNVDPQDLIPKLPKPKDLQPFPTKEAIVYKGHEDIVRCISVDPTGQWFISGSDDQTVKLWEISTGRCMKSLHVGGPVKSIAWCPNVEKTLIAICVGQSIMIINSGMGDKLLLSTTDDALSSFEPSGEASTGKTVPIEWTTYDGKEYADGFRIKLSHPKDVAQVTWHAKGDYFATVMPAGESMSVLIHQLSKRRSQNPFSKSKGLVQRVLFHPLRPYFFVATQQYVRMYNLLKQELTKKLMTNCKWVSSMAVHSAGDNVIIGSYDCRLSWFDLDLSTKPYQTLRHHKKAIRQVCYHKTYPLFASASDDGNVIVCHGKVYNDLLQNPMIVPVKVLRGHKMTKDLTVLDCQFHPTQPWILTSGADATIRLFT